MIDKTIEITAFIKKYYTPGTIEDTEPDFQLKLSEVLDLLFQVFPNECIDEYDLHQILTSIGYKPHRKGPKDFVYCLKEL